MLFHWDYGGNIVSASPPAICSPRSPQAIRQQASVLSMPSDTQPFPMHQSCARLCAGCQGHTGEQDRHGFPTPEALAHLSHFHPEISLRKSMLSRRAPAASAPPPDGVKKDSNTVVYPKESGRKPTQDFREVARYKINIYKQPAEVIMLAKISFAMLTMKIKYFGIHLTKKCAKPYKKKC